MTSHRLSTKPTAAERVKDYEQMLHAAIRPDGLRAIAEGVAAPNSKFTISDIQECLRVAADKIEADGQAAKIP